MHYLSITFFMVLSFLGTSVAFAQGDELLELAKPVLEALLAGQYAYAVALALVLAVALLRRYGGSRYPILASRKAAPWLVMTASLFGAAATALGTGASLSLAMLWSATTVAVGAAGSYSLLKAILMPLEDRAPAWFVPVFKLAALLFTSKARAKEAGEKAVQDSPAKGTGIEFDEFP